MSTDPVEPPHLTGHVLTVRVSVSEVAVSGDGRAVSVLLSPEEPLCKPGVCGRRRGVGNVLLVKRKRKILEGLVTNRDQKVLYRD